MTTPITGTSFSDVMATQQSTAPKPGPQELGKDTFLKLLVAQLKYQNPLDPQDGSEFLAQSAQFTMVEKLQEIATQGAEMRTLASASLVGRTVSYTDSDGASKTGVVDTVRQTPGGSVLEIDGNDVPIASVTSVTQTAAAAAPATPAASAAPATTPTTRTVGEDTSSTEAPDTAASA